MVHGGMGWGGSCGGSCGGAWWAEGADLAAIVKKKEWRMMQTLGREMGVGWNRFDCRRN